jgi:predicted enzyme related to lactoylglutathione lyase
MLLVPPRAPSDLPLDPELAKLGFAPGHWLIAETYPPGAVGPKGGEGQGEAWVRTGPGGHFLIVQSRTRGPFGEVEGEAIYAWDAAAGRYRGQFMSSLASLVEQHEGQWADGRASFEGQAGPKASPVFVRFTVAPRNGAVTIAFEVGATPDSRRPALTQVFKPSPRSRRDAAHGIGGIFFKAKDSRALAAWYRDHLGLPVEDPQKWTGAVLEWRDPRDPGRRATTVWGVFKQETKYFEPSPAPFMLNFRVDDLDAVLARLRKAGVTVDERVEDEENGRFGWAMDPEGNRIELWQPAPGH